MKVPGLEVPSTRSAWLPALAAACLFAACAAGGEGDRSASISLAPEGEPGERMILSGTVYAADGRTPLAGARLRVFQTDHEGYYKKGPFGIERGWRRARLAGDLVLGTDGRYEVRSIKPAGYPDSTVPSHVHVTIWAAGYPEQEHTVYFEGDGRITEALRQGVARDGRGAILPLERGADGTLRCTWDLVAVREE